MKKKTIAVGLAALDKSEVQSLAEMVMDPIVKSAIASIPKAQQDRRIRKFVSMAKIRGVTPRAIKAAMTYWNL